MICPLFGTQSSFFELRQTETTKKTTTKNDYTHANRKVGYNDSSVGDDDDVLDTFLGHIAALVSPILVVFDLDVDRLLIGVCDRHCKWSDSGRPSVHGELQRRVHFHAVLFKTRSVSSHLTVRLTRTEN